MKKGNREKRRGKYQSRIFILLCSISLVPVLIAGLISYRIYMEEVTKQTDLSMEATQMQISNDVEGVLSSMRQYYMEETAEEEILWLMQTRSIPYREYSDLYDAQKILQGPAYFSEYVANYAFINRKDGWILSNKGMYLVQDVKNTEQVDLFLERAAADPSTLYWFNNIEDKSPYENGLYESGMLDVSGFQLVMKLPGIANRMDQLLLVQLNLANMHQNIRKNLAGYDVCILNKTGEVFYTTNEALASYCRENSSVLSELSENRNISVGEQKDYRIRSGGGYSSNGLIYVVAYNLNEVKEGAGKILTVSLLLMLALLLILTACMAVTSILYRPVKSLKEYVSQAVGSQEERLDEFTYIRENVGELIHTRESLQELVRNQQKMLTEQFLVRAIRGEMTPEAIHNGEEQFHLKKVRAYRLLASACMLDSETDQESGLENEALSMAIAQRMPEEIQKLLTAPAFCHNEQILMIIGADTEEQLQKKTLEAHTALTLYIEGEYGCSIMSGVSQQFTGLKYLRTAYNECTETLRNTGSRSHGRSDMTFYEDIAGDDGIISGYDFVAENSLTKAVNNGDGEEAAQMVDKFVNSLNNRGISRHDRNLYLYRLVIAVLSVLSDAGLTANQVFAQYSEDIFRKMNDIYESDKLKSYINSQIVQPSIEALKQYRFNASSDILKNILESVRETQGNITLTECAERLHYHPSYIWKVLKAEKNMTFTDLVNMEKLEKAKQLLLQTELTVADIAVRLNYSNTQNFIRFFSKYENMTPGKYRKEYQDSHMEG